jgi:hypothetical protein
LDSRTRFAIGGVSTVVASVAVVCAVALTNSVALIDTAGAPLKVGPIVVPSPLASAGTAASPPTAAAPRVATVAPAVPAAPGVAEAGPAPASERMSGTATVVSDPPAAYVIPATADAALEQSRASGSWAPVREWARSAGWSQGRIDAWIKRLEKAAGKTAATDESAGKLASVGPSRLALPTEKDSRPSAKAHAGSKKDQSRDSPGRRD